jgi:peptidoglycan hydrolase CwlO-like protein
MSQEYNDRQDLEREVKDYGKQIETLGESQKEYQEDIESLQERLKLLKNGKGVYANADNKMIATVEAAIQTRETNVDDCRQNIGEVKTQMDGKIENLNKKITTQEKNIGGMENLENSLDHKNDGIVNNITIEIQNQKDDLEDAKDKRFDWLKISQIAATLLTAFGMAAQGISQLVDSLKSIGILR